MRVAIPIFYRIIRLTLNIIDMRKMFMVAAVAATVFSVDAETSLRIVRGVQDTVFNPKHVIVGLTDSKSVTINGKPVHVYNTGAFGGQVELASGDNEIVVSALTERKRKTERFNVFLAEKPVKSKLAETEEEEIVLPVPQYVVTTDGAYLQYGNGGDRLGGSKMGELEEGITLKVVATKERLYKVELSKNRFAYIPKSKTEPTQEVVATVNSGSWSISDEGKSDRVSISLPRRLAYRSWVQLDPTTICIEIFGAMNNSNWITQRGNLGMIDYVDCRQEDSDVLKVMLKLKEEFSWGYSVAYNGNNLVVDVKHAPELNLGSLTIGLDAGHGGEYPGARSVSGLKEKDVNLDIVLRIAELLKQKGAQVVLSRGEDMDVTMAERKKIFAEADVDIMLSVHNNSGGSPLALMGTSAYYKHISNRKLAECMLNRLLELGLKNFGLTGNFNFSLNAPTEYPNVLLEVLFMSSLPEEEKLADEKFRQQVAEKAVAGLEDYLELVRQSR